MKIEIQPTTALSKIEDKPTFKSRDECIDKVRTAMRKLYPNLTPDEIQKIISKFSGLLVHHADSTVFATLVDYECDTKHREMEVALMIKNGNFS